jgi:hypothetical protein
LDICLQNAYIAIYFIEKTGFIMKILLRALPIFLLMGLCTVSLAQSNNPSGTNPPGSGTGIDATMNPGNPGGNNNAQGASLSTAVTHPTNGGGPIPYTPLTQQQIDNLNQSITQLQNRLQQINDPNDPMAIKLQDTIDRIQEILNNQ